MRKPTKVALATCMAAVLAACGGNDVADVSDKDTLVIAQGADATTLDPHATNDQPSSRVAVQIYSQLVEVDANMEIIPGLASSWEHLNDYTTQFKLREGVKFHNGEIVKASDVKFTLDRMMASPTVSHIVGALDSVEIVDEYTVNLTTSEPFGPLLYHLSHTASSIMSEKAVTKGGNDYGQKPVGSGPYKFVDWSVGDRITMEVFDDYYGGKQEIENVVFRNITEGSNRTIALETGEVDISYDIAPVDKDSVLNHRNLDLVEAESLSTTYVGFNFNKAPFDNKLIRQAVAYAINQDDIIEAVEMGAGIASNSPISQQVFGYNPDAKHYKQNIEKARELMAEAGFADGFDTSIWTNDNPVRIQIAEVMQAQLRQIGIRMAIEVVEWGAFLDGTNRGEHEMFMMGWVTVTGDADYGLYALFNSATHGGAGNRSFYTNPQVDDMLNTARTSTDQEERRALYGELQEILMQELPIVPIYVKYDNAGRQNSVTGFNLNPAGHHKLRGIRFEG